jgi:hypothetical protein
MTLTTTMRRISMGAVAFQQFSDGTAVALGGRATHI